MTVHLVKLCAGVQSAADLIARQTAFQRAGGADALCHVTRNFPRRAAEILDGGSLYWIIGGVFALRQGVRRLDPLADAEGNAACRIGLAPTLVPVAPAPRRPFQGWRYLPAADAPPDLDEGNSHDLASALSRLGLC